MPWAVAGVASTTTFTTPSVATQGAQFLTLGPTGSDYVRFTLQVAEDEPMVLTELAPYYPLLNDTPASQP